MLLILKVIINFVQREILCIMWFQTSLVSYLCVGCAHKNLSRTLSGMSS